MSSYLLRAESCMWNPVKWAIEAHHGFNIEKAMAQFQSVYATDDAFTSAYTLLFGDEALKATLRKAGLSDKKVKNSNLGIFPSENSGYADNAMLHLSVARRFSASEVLCSKDLYEAGLIPNKDGHYKMSNASFAVCYCMRRAIVNFFKWNSNNDASRCWQYTTHSAATKDAVVQILSKAKCPYFYVNHDDEFEKEVHSNHYHIYFASRSSKKIQAVVSSIAESFPSQDLKYSLKSIELKEEERSDSRNAFENIANYLTTFVPKRGGFNARTYFNSNAVDKCIFDTRSISKKYFGSALIALAKKELKEYDIPTQVLEMVHTLLEYSANFDSQLSPAALKLATAVVNHTRKRNKVARFAFFKEALSSLLNDESFGHMTETALFCAHQYTGLQVRFSNVGCTALSNAIKAFNHHNYANHDFFLQVDRFASGKKELLSLLSDERALQALFYRILALKHWKERDSLAYHWPSVIVDAYSEALRSLNSGPPSLARSLSNE